jgi:hypothetical protein
VDEVGSRGHEPERLTSCSDWCKIGHHLRQECRDQHLKGDEPSIFSQNGALTDDRKCPEAVRGQQRRWGGRISDKSGSGIQFVISRKGGERTGSGSCQHVISEESGERT